MEAGSGAVGTGAVAGATAPAEGLAGVPTVTSLIATTNAVPEQADYDAASATGASAAVDTVLRSTNMEVRVSHAV